MLRPLGLLSLALSLAVAFPAQAQENSTAPASPRFLNANAALGLDGLANSAAAWGDVDADGWPELLTGGVLWRNRAGQGFEQAASIGQGLLADLDRDGDLDLFAYAGQRAFLNDGAGAFVEQDLGEFARTNSRGAACGDFDGDGWVDVYVGGYEDWDAGITYPDHLLRNDHEGGFELVFVHAPERARGVCAADFDEDGDLDVYVSNYRLQANRLWVNDGTGVLEEDAAARGALATSEGFGGGHSIGAAWGDFDNDGHLDLFAGNFAHVDDRGDQPKSRFLRNTGPAGQFVFVDQGESGVHYQESYASPAAADYDNDGDLDLYFTTVYGTASFGRANQPALFENLGDWQFRDVADELGLGGLAPTYQAAWGDHDLDGDLDLVSAGALWENSGGGGWLGVRLAGGVRDAIGAQVRLRGPDLEGVLVRQLEVGTGEGNQNAGSLHFGLGAAQGPFELELRWPGGDIQRMDGVRPRTLVEWDQSSEEPQEDEETQSLGYPLVTPLDRSPGRY